MNQADEPERGPILRAAVGIGLYAAAFGMAYGAVAVGSGLSVGQAMVLSLVMFSGASQFAFAGAVAAGSPLVGVAAALLLGVRNAFYGVPMSAVLAPRGVRRLWTAHFVIDETTAMAVGQPTRPAQRYAFWATGLILFTLWQLGSLAGALVGAVVDPADFGLEAAAPAVFLALLWPSLRQASGRVVALAGAAVALVLVPLAPSGVPVIAAAGVALVAGLAPARGAQHVTALWVATAVAAVGCYLLKLAGMSLPESVLDHPRVQRVASFLPIAMLSALVAVELFDGGGRYAVDWRVLAGVAAGVVALLLRRGLLVVFLVAIAVTAGLRLVT